MLSPQSLEGELTHQEARWKERGDGLKGEAVVDLKQNTGIVTFQLIALNIYKRSITCASLHTEHESINRQRVVSAAAHV